MTIWTITMTGVALIFWAVSIAARIETRRLRKTQSGNTLIAALLKDDEDVTKCIEALLEIRSIEVPSFSDCRGCKLRGHDAAWTTNKLLCGVSVTARNVLREIKTPVKCEFCNDGYVACSSPNCFGGNTRDGEYCQICHGSGAMRCEDCDGKGVC